MDLKEISNNLIDQLKKFEEEENKAIESEVSDWLQERETMFEVEEDLIRKNKEDREEFFKMEAIEKEAHEQAVSKLGYYFYSRVN